MRAALRVCALHLASAPYTLYRLTHLAHRTPHTSYLTPHTSHLAPPTSNFHLLPSTPYTLLTPRTSHLLPPTSRLTPPTPHRYETLWLASGLTPGGTLVTHGGSTAAAEVSTVHSQCTNRGFVRYLPWRYVLRLYVLWLHYYRPCGRGSPPWVGRRAGRKAARRCWRLTRRRGVVGG